MKTKHWLILLGSIFALCIAAAVLLSLQTPAACVKVISDGKTVAVLDLSEDTELTVPYEGGSNTVTVQDGFVCVSAATCPDGYCMKCGSRNCGLPIICLPNRLVLQFSDRGDIDGITR